MFVVLAAVFRVGHLPLARVLPILHIIYEIAVLLIDNLVVLNAIAGRSLPLFGGVYFLDHAPEFVQFLLLLDGLVDELQRRQLGHHLTPHTLHTPHTQLAVIIEVFVPGVEEVEVGTVVLMAGDGELRLVGGVEEGVSVALGQ